MNQIYSPNMLKTFELCPQKFFFKYIKNINMPTNDEIFELGKNIHAIASYYLKKENIDKMEKSLNEREVKIWQHLKNIEYFSYEGIETEFFLTTKIDNTFFGGRLDALVKNSNGDLFVLDYKTGGIPKDATYDFQTMIYLLAAKEYYKAKNTFFVYIDLKNKTELKIELTSELEKEYNKKLSGIVNKIHSSDFSSKSSYCNCEYKIICY